jgi:putative ABC transport system permease protein
MLRNLTAFWRLHLAVLAGAAVTATVLTGALAVGDSMRESLRRLWLERLGDVELAAVAPRFFHAAVADEMARRLRCGGTGGPGAPAAAPGTGGGSAAGVAGASSGGDKRCRVAPAIVLSGSAVHATSHRRAARVAILGIDERFAALYPGAAAPLPAASGSGDAPGGAPALALNQTLARQLGAAPGDDVLLSWEQPSAIPRSLLLAAKDPEAQLATHRLKVTRVVPDRGPGSFDLAVEQATPPNAFLPLAALQHELGEDGRANALLAGGLRPGPRGAAAAGDALAASLRLADLGLALRPASVAGEAASLTLESREFFLSPAVEQGARAAAAELSAATQQVSTYLAITLDARGRAIPYSLVSALGPPLAPGELRAPGGAPVAAPAGDEILLDSWAAEELAARPGDAVELSYFLPASGNASAPLRTAGARFRLRGVVAMAGLAVDRGLTPPIPGIDQAPDMASWSPPFPVDLHRVRPRDEEFWRLYGPAPKAFVSLAAARRCWRTGFGDTTGLRIALPPGAGAQAFAARFERRLLARLPPAASGLALRPVRAAGLRAAAEGTDFGPLFVSFSSFLIVSSALLTGLLFALGLERRAREIGLLLALGYRRAAVRRRFLGEGLALAGAGALLGAAGATAYAALLLGGLGPAIAAWQPAAGMPRLALAVQPSTLALGWLAAVFTVAAFLAAGVRRLSRLPAARLLAGAVAAGRGGRRRGRWLVLGLGAAVAAAVACGAALLGRPGGSPALAFGAGAAVLAAGICGFALWCREAGRGDSPLPGLAALGVRNTAANPGRSVLCVGLVAGACFVLVLVAANRRGGAPEQRDWSGFTLLADAATPLYQDLARPEGRRILGFSAAAEPLLAGSEIAGLSAVPGDDASCLNLFRPQRPRLLGVPPELAHRRLATTGGERTLAELFARSRGAGEVPAVGDEQTVRWMLHLDAGGALTLADDRGAPLVLRIAGLLAGSPLQGALLIPEADLARRFPRRGGRTVFLVRPPPGREEAVAGLLAGTLREFGLEVVPVAERLRLYAGVEDTYLASFQALGSLGLLLGTGGLAVVLLRNAVERRWELAALRAFGFRRRRLAGLLLLENATLLVIGVALGTAAGLLPEALGAGAAGAFAWRPLAATLGGVLAAGLLASAGAVAGALAAPLLPALKAEP